MAPIVLMVAEKPSIATAVASLLSGGQMRSRRGHLDVHEFRGHFQGQAASFRVTSVIGHVLSLDFPAQYQNWDTVDPAELFDAPAVKMESNPKAHVCRHLQQEARGCQYLVLWLDCDREGENICFEVMDNTLPWMAQPPQHQQQVVYRARFSAVSDADVRAAMAALGAPNENEARAVDARQEIDLKVGVAFTRFQTRFFHNKYGTLDSSVISYGPCQTPTLGFCVQRHQHIATFAPEPFWRVRPTLQKSGRRIDLEWKRGHVFDRQAGSMFEKLVSEGASTCRVVAVGSKEEGRARPRGLTTVELLKAASSVLGLGPQHTMQVAERLYTQGVLSYPRTESSAYPPSFDARALLAAHAAHPVWGPYAAQLLAAGPSLTSPHGGHDAGDHPPITPTRAVTSAELGDGDAWRVYDYVARHFLGSVSPDCRYVQTKVVLTAGGEQFSCSGHRTVFAGYTAVMPWLAMADEGLPPFAEGEVVPLLQVELHQGRTSPPDYLTESELITLMEKHGIGTDASIPVHINNICERNYCQVVLGRRLVPTALGVALVRGYQHIDADLCLPDIRRYIEQQITLIARGQADYTRVVRHALLQFSRKFAYFVSQLYKGNVCPLDGYELLLASHVGLDAKSFYFCPYCYSHPPFQDVARAMSCILCRHATCPHSATQLGVCACPECEGGLLLLDPVSAPRWRLACNTRNCIVCLPRHAHRISTCDARCEECGSHSGSGFQQGFLASTRWQDSAPCVHSVR
eukprot:jgi/Mesen1/10209/ME000077S09546